MGSVGLRFIRVCNDKIKFYKITNRKSLGNQLKHVIELDSWFISNDRENAVWLESGYGPGMLISVHEDSPNIATIQFCTSGYDCCSYFNLNNLHWNGDVESQDQNKIYRNFQLMEDTPTPTPTFTCAPL